MNSKPVPISELIASSEQPAKTGKQQALVRSHCGRFAPGVSGNPAGRPEGSRNRATLALQEILLADGQRVVQKAVQMALQGNEAALRLVIERLLPVAKDRPITLALPVISNASDVAEAALRAMQAVANGEITPSEAETVLKLLEGLRTALRSKFEDKGSEDLHRLLGGE